MSRHAQNGPRSNAFKPQLEEMEGRWVPDAAGAVGNIFNIASQAILYQAAVGNLKAALPAAAQNAAIANQLNQIARDIAAVSAANNQTLQQSAKEVGQAVAEVTQNLNNALAQATEQTIKDFNDQVLAAQRQIDSLPAEQRAAAQTALAKQVFTLADGTQLRLKQFRDMAGSQQRAIVEFLSGLVPLYSVTLGRTQTTEVEARGIEALTGGGGDSTPSPAPSGIRGLITTLSPFKELDVVGFDPRFPDGICSVADYNEIVRAGGQPPNVIDPATGQPPPTS
jgi:hypothetical protein